MCLGRKQLQRDFMLNKYLSVVDCYSSIGIGCQSGVGLDRHTVVGPIGRVLEV